MKSIVKTKWKGQMTFESMVSEHLLTMDAKTEFGGMDKGPRPKELLLSSLAGCSGMDVASLLEKMRVEIKDFDISIEAELTEEHPKVYKYMHIVYEFYGHDLPIEKIQKAVDLSQNKYCGVSAMFKKAFPVTYEIKLHNV
jgi:putative redox protein